MHKIQDRITQVNIRIKNAASNAGRNPQAITLLAVSKRQPNPLIQAAYDAGLRDFGENYLQEAVEKIAVLAMPEARWHFIGPIQSNKTRAIAEHFQWVHSVDRLKIAQRLSEQRSPALPPLQICLQVNIDNEDTKSGVKVTELETLALAVAELPHLQLRGLMTIPATQYTAHNSPFVRLQTLFERLKKHPQLANMDTLSMGMSGDMEDAIAAGSTQVRIGTALFGERTH
ncbi:YggS family pyridoxal phosphate-dependent enzyme [Teredinibacter turnerae]|uniref:YggS family pyridoxal phosphate-dependent enzyme n=1 Tax=Teredinibacter turnerae TaxID=2426 RepID=UPI000361320F|nr:YggS family pyridoxal phosphate-dependent enzyme [Teredinibacter turnerae]